MDAKIMTDRESLIAHPELRMIEQRTAQSGDGFSTTITKERSTRRQESSSWSSIVVIFV